MDAQSIAGIQLAAGKGTRMKSDLPKGLHRICGVPMVEVGARAMRAAGVEKPVIVIGHGGDLVQAQLGDGYGYAWQHEQRGTGHAARMGYEAIAGHHGPVLIGFGDTPLVDETVYRRLLEAVWAGASCAFASAILPNPFGYGRVLEEDGLAVRVVEEKDASPDQRQIQKVNAGVYCFDGAALEWVLPQLTDQNAQNEFYLTDTVHLLAGRGDRVVAVDFPDHAVLMGVNDRWQLAAADAELNRRTLKRHAIAGVTLIQPETLRIGLDVEVGKDVIIHSGSVLEGRTVVGAGAEIGPNTRLVDAEVGERARVLMSCVVESSIGADGTVGPFAHLRGHSEVGVKCRIGNFVELKNTKLADLAKASHLTYLGDATVGSDANIGAGTITCNYDGVNKHRTSIGAGAFVGSNSTLVAPISIGAGAMVAAGSVVTSDVPADALAVGRARQENKDAWVAQWRDRKRQEKNR